MTAPPETPTGQPPAPSPVHPLHRIEETVARGICIGCGLCATSTDGAIPLSLGTDGLLVPDLAGVSESDRRRASLVCPFSDESADEDELGPPADVLGTAHRAPLLGAYTTVGAGRRADDAALERSSSGGLTSWLTEQLLTDGLVDAVIHVGSATDGKLFASRVSEHLASDDGTRKSRYYPTSLDEAMTHVRETEGRYVLVGVPCMIRAARNLGRLDPVVRERLRFFVGLVCGHMKTTGFAESLAWQLGIAPSALGEFDFRVKNPGSPSNDYDVLARSSDGHTEVRAPSRDLLGTNWGHAAFQPEACNFCDDIFAETADVVFGDAWIPRFEADWRGTNVYVSRNPVIDTILETGARRGEIHLEPLEPGAVEASQGGNYRHRREGLAVRLADDIGRGLSVPRKRVEPSLTVVDSRRRAVIRHRREMAEQSQVVFARAKELADLDVYTSFMRKEIRAHSRLERHFIRRALGRARRLARSLARRLRA